MNATKQSPVKPTQLAEASRDYMVNERCKRAKRCPRHFRKSVKTVVGAAHFVIDCNPIPWAKEMEMAITDRCFGAIAIDRETLERGVVALSTDAAAHLEAKGRDVTARPTANAKQAFNATRTVGIGLLHVI